MTVCRPCGAEVVELDGYPFERMLRRTALALIAVPHECRGYLCWETGLVASVHPDELDLPADWRPRPPYPGPQVIATAPGWHVRGSFVDGERALPAAA